MSVWRRVKIDLRLLSNGVLLYGLYYLLGLGAYLLSLGVTNSNALQQAIPLLALSMGVLTHIANERADRVDDNVTVLLGGRFRRITTRMISTGIYNLTLVSIGCLVTIPNEVWNLRLQPGWIATVAWILLLYSTAGVVVAAAIPHPLVSISATSVLVFAGGASSDENFLMASILKMARSQHFDEWLGQALLFASPWLLAALFLLPIALGHISIRVPNLLRKPERAISAVPVWASWKSNFFNTSFLTSITNPLPILGAVAAILAYTYSSLLLASKFASIGAGGNLLPMFTGVILVNVFPAVLLSMSVHPREVLEQESFLYRSSDHALRARLFQTALVIIVATVAMLALIAHITGSSWTATGFRNGALELVFLCPGLTALALAIGQRIRSPIVLTLVSYGVTLSELLISRLIPPFTGWLPSSLFAQAAGGRGLYLLDAYQSAPTLMAECIVILIGLFPFWHLIIRKVKPWHDK